VAFTTIPPLTTGLAAYFLAQNSISLQWNHPASSLVTTLSFDVEASRYRVLSTVFPDSWQTVSINVFFFYSVYIFI